MKKSLLSIAGIVFSTYLFLGSSIQNRVISKFEDVTEKMEKNDVIYKNIIDMDFNENYMFMLEEASKCILKIDYTSGKLDKVISRIGEGPGELTQPIAIKVKKNKIYVSDSKYLGIKIFDINGIFLNEFKLPKVSTLSFSNFDLNENEDIYFQNRSEDKKYLISVYNRKGELLKSLIPNTNNDDNYDPQNFFKISLDSNGYIYLLFFVKGNLAKYDLNGTCIWQKKISNPLLDPIPVKESKKLPNKSFIVSYKIFCFLPEINNNVFIGHGNGGMVFNDQGNILETIQFNVQTGETPTIQQIKKVGDKLAFLIYPYPSDQKIIIVDKKEVLNEKKQ